MSKSDTQVNYDQKKQHRQNDYESDSLKRYSDHLEKAEGKDKYICPVCGGNDLSINPNTGAFTCFTGECDRSEIFFETKKLAGQWKEFEGNPTSNTYKGKTKQKQPKSNIPQPVEITPDSIKFATSENVFKDTVIPRIVKRKEEYLPSDVKKLIEQGKEVIAYDYFYSDTLVKVKYEWSKGDSTEEKSKTYQWKHKDPGTGEIKLGKGNQPVKPYGIDDALNQGQGKTVFVVEGEKDVETLISTGFLAINSKDISLLEPLMPNFKDADITLAIIADNDKAGENTARKLSNICHIHQVKCIEISMKSLWDNCPNKGDISDYLKHNPMDSKQFIANLEQEIHKAIHIRTTKSNRDNKADNSSELVASQKLETVKLSNNELLSFIRINYPSLAFNERIREVELEGQSLDLEFVYLTELAEKHHIEANKRVASDSFKAIALENRYDPVKRYLEALVNGLEPASINNLATRYLGTNNLLCDVFLKKTLIAAVARVYDPGCQVDTVLILQGEQGIGKSSFFKTLAGKYFDDSMTGKLDKDDLLIFHKCWIQELGEFEYIARSKKAEEIKRFISSRSDSIRVPYGATVKDYPRKSILVGSVNSSEFLKDHTGNRRFWVIPVGSHRIDIEQLKKERDAIWAGAVRAYLNGEQWWLNEKEEELNRENNEKYRETDPLEDIVAKYIKSQEQVSIPEIIQQCYLLEKGERKQDLYERLPRILTSLSWKKAGRKQHRGERKNVWQPNNKHES